MDNQAGVGSFEQLFNDCYKQLWATALLQTHNADIANDVIQDTAMSAFCNFNKLRGKSYFKTWITRILLNNIKRHYKTQKIHEELDENITYLAGQQEDRIIFLEAINTLNKKERQLIILKYVSGYTVPELSKILRIPQGTIKSKLSRSIKKLKANLGEDYI